MAWFFPVQGDVVVSERFKGYPVTYRRFSWRGRWRRSPCASC